MRFIKLDFLRLNAVESKVLNYKARSQLNGQVTRYIPFTSLAKAQAKSLMVDFPARCSDSY